jgi:hypothetical protein
MQVEEARRNAKKIGALEVKQKNRCAIKIGMSSSQEDCEMRLGKGYGEAKSITCSEQFRAQP